MLSAQDLVFSNNNSIGGFVIKSELLEKNISPLNIKRGGNNTNKSLFSKNNELILPVGLVSSSMPKTETQTNSSEISNKVIPNDVVSRFFNI